MSQEQAVVTPAVAAEVRRGATRLARRLRLERAPGSESGSKISVLAHLNTLGPSSPKEIAVAERQQPQSLTRSLAELEADNLIERTVNAADARSSILTITEGGAEVLRQDMISRDLWLAGAMSELSDLEVQVLLLAARIMNRIA